MITVGEGPPLHAVRFGLAVLAELLNVYFAHEDLRPRDVDQRFIYAAFGSNDVSLALATE